jgi:amino acid permease
MSDSFSSPNKEKAFEVDIASAERASSNGSYTPPPDSRLHRELKNRHVAMIR